jgi:hypothetical protein
MTLLEFPKAFLDALEAPEQGSASTLPGDERV